MDIQRVLIVDDDMDFANSLADLVEEQGFEITCVSSGEEAVKLFDRESFDLTFMDVRMPGMDGVECLIEIRKKKPDAKIVMMTGYTAEALLGHARSHGAIDVLDKPVSLDRLFDSLDRIKPSSLILVVDDDEVFSDSLSELLSQHGYKVCEARSGREALDVVSENNIDLIIMDLRMPEMSGYEACSKLREAGNELPVIVITAYPHEESQQIEKMSPYTASNYLIKPVKPVELLQAIQSVLHSS